VGLFNELGIESEKSDMSFGLSTDDGTVGTFTPLYFCVKHQVMTASMVLTASMVHETNLTPPGSDNPRMACGRSHRSTPASVVRVANRVTPGSECIPTRR
jgi:hypothetical protein